jgi:hypothetical protein
VAEVFTQHEQLHEQKSQFEIGEIRSSVLQVLYFPSDATMNNITGEFIDYREESLDPGWSFIVGSLVACILLNATLPCLVSVGSRYERRRNETNFKSSDGSTDGGNWSRGSAQENDQHAAVANIDRLDADPNPEMQAQESKYTVPVAETSNSMLLPCFGESILDWFYGFADSVCSRILESSL